MMWLDAYVGRSVLPEKVWRTAQSHIDSSKRIIKQDVFSTVRKSPEALSITVALRYR